MPKLQGIHVNPVGDLTRLELFERLSNAMNGHPSADRFGFRHRPGNVRTVAIEVEGNGTPDPLERVQQVAASLGMRMWSTADASLAVLVSDAGGVFVDVVDPRFWLLHTTGPSSWLDGPLGHLAAKSADADWCWLPLSLIARMQLRGRTRWFKSDFRGDELLPRDGVRARRLKVQLEGDDADDLRRYIALRPDYAAAEALTGVTVELGHGELDSLSVAIHYRGGFIGHGARFEPHNAFVAEAIGDYSANVRRTEEQVALRWDVHDGSRATFDGEPVEIRLGRPITDLNRFAAGIFAAKDPFRLWAVPTSVGPDRIEAEVADLHVGQSFNVDITTDRILIYLTAGSCANTVFRLLANLQHRYDATASVWSSAGQIA